MGKFCISSFAFRCISSLFTSFRVRARTCLYVYNNDAKPVLESPQSIKTAKQQVFMFVIFPHKTV